MPWTTTFIEAGDTARCVGRVDLHIEQGKVDASQTIAKDIPIDGTIQGKPEVVSKIAGYIFDIEANYLTQFPTLKTGHLFDTLTKAPFQYGMYNGAYMVADALRAAAGVRYCDGYWWWRHGPCISRFGGNITVYEAFNAIPHSMGETIYMVVRYTNTIWRPLNCRLRSNSSAAMDHQAVIISFFLQA